MRKTAALLLVWILGAVTGRAQSLQPGFDADEYIEMLGVSAGQMHQPAAAKIPLSRQYHMVYRSSETGLKNRWDLWLNKDSTIMLISLRGTTADQESWLENFYAAMIPAAGELQLNDSTVFHYRFSDDPKAAVHAGWTIGIGSMMPGIMEKLKTYYAKGIRQLMIMGHNYVLFELSFISPPPNVFPAVQKLLERGYKPILAHPERYSYMDINQIKAFRDWGCNLQLNTISLTGYYGKSAMKMAESLVDNHMIDFISSDMHHPKHAEAFKRALKMLYVQRLLTDYPLKNILLK